MTTTRLLVAILLLQTGTARQPATASIAGIVVQNGASDPVSRATVELTGIEGDHVRSYKATTGANGRFEFRDLPPGRGYQLIAIRSPEYLPAQYGQSVPNLPGLPITLTGGQQLRDLKITMTRAAVITGHVVTAEDRPLGPATQLGQRVDLRVVALRPWYHEGRRILTEVLVDFGGKHNASPGAVTNTQGEYRISGLLPGQYYLYASRQTSIDLVSAYFPAAGTAAQAAPITLRAGETFKGADIVAVPLRMRRVRGEVIDSTTGKPIQAGQITIARRDATAGTFVGAVPGTRIVEQTQNGVDMSIAALIPNRPAFDFPLYPGSYFLTATVDEPGGPMFGRVPLEVGSMDITELRVIVTPGFTVPGRVVIDGLDSLTAGDLARSTVSLRPLSAGIPFLAPVGLTPRGAFVLKDLAPGSYRVELFPILSVPPSALAPSTLQTAYVKSVRLGSEDVLNAGLHLESQPSESLEIVVALNGGMLEGLVLTENRTPAANTQVVLVPDAARRRRGDLYKSAITDAAGRYQILGIVPGDYKAFAWESVETGAWHDPNFIRLYEEKGIAVQIDAGGRRNFELFRIAAWN